MWLIADRARLRSDTLERLGDADATRLLSAASVWEMTIKHAQGRLPLPKPLALMISRARAERSSENYRSLPLTRSASCIYRRTIATRSTGCSWRRPRSRG